MSPSQDLSHIFTLPSAPRGGMFTGLGISTWTSLGGPAAGRGGQQCPVSSWHEATVYLSRAQRSAKKTPELCALHIPLKCTPAGWCPALSHTAALTSCLESIGPGVLHSPQCWGCGCVDLTEFETLKKTGLQRTFSEAPIPRA
jgi:hypothetical protein